MFFLHVLHFHIPAVQEMLCGWSGLEGKVVKSGILQERFWGKWQNTNLNFRNGYLLNKWFPLLTFCLTHVFPDKPQIGQVTGHYSNNLVSCSSRMNQLCVVSVLETSRTLPKFNKKCLSFLSALSTLVKPHSF